MVCNERPLLDQIAALASFVATWLFVDSRTDNYWIEAAGVVAATFLAVLISVGFALARETDARGARRGSQDARLRR